MICRTSRIDASTSKRSISVSRAPVALFFDLDGTLTDPKLGITNCIRHAMQSLDMPAPHADELEWCIGPPLFDSFVQLVGEAYAARAVGLYRERFAEIGLFENVPYAGIESVLQHCAEHHPLYVASSKPRVFVERILERFKLADYFRQAFGSELDGTRSNKSELLAYALQTTRETAESSVMIGDRMHDAAGAASQGMSMVGVLYGYGSRAELSEAGVQTLVATPEELPNAILRATRT